MGYSKPSLEADEQPLEFSYLHHESSGRMCDKKSDQLSFRCPNNYSELALLVPGIDTFLEGPEHQLRENKH